MWGLTGARMFSPPEMNEKDEIYHVMILTLQCAYFGPFPKKYVELSDDITMGDLDGIEGLVIQRGGRRKYRNTLATNMSKETVSFLDKFMKLDPRDRPSPQELLQDQWLSGVVD
jgi:serine/threonine protein kinase